MAKESYSDGLLHFLRCCHRFLAQLLSQVLSSPYLVKTRELLNRVKIARLAVALNLLVATLVQRSRRPSNHQRLPDAP